MADKGVVQASAYNLHFLVFGHSGSFPPSRQDTRASRLSSVAAQCNSPYHDQMALPMSLAKPRFRAARVGWIAALGLGSLLGIALSGCASLARGEAQVASLD